MAQGGARPGAGRKKGSLQKVTLEAKLRAAEAGMLPHEWLLAVSRGDPVKQMVKKVEYDAKGRVKKEEWVEQEVYADFPMRVDCAKAAAPFYAPKLATQTVNLQGNATDRVAEALEQLAERLPS